MVVCLTSARFNMKADILRQGAETNNTVNPTDQTGEWVTQQDPDSGEIIRKWQKYDQVDNPATADTNEGLDTFKCVARGIIDGGIRVAGSTERWGEIYDNVDYVKITFGPNVVINRRDRITNIRDSRGHIIWKEEERPDAAPTIFNVSGITPIIDPFGRHIESFALLERVEGQ
jgi:hypothetical protein